MGVKMSAPIAQRHGLSRRAALRVGAGAALGAAAAALPRLTWAAPRPTGPAGTAAVGDAQGADSLFCQLDERIEAGMTRYHIPGVAVGVYYQGREHVRGYGVTNVDSPQPVDG